MAGVRGIAKTDPSSHQKYRSTLTPASPRAHCLAALLLCSALLAACGGGSGSESGGSTPANPSNPSNPSTPSAPSPPPAPTGAIYTDVISVPAGGYVTVYGIDASTSNWNIAYHGNGRTVVQAPSNAALGATTVTVDGTNIPLTIHTGRVLIATTNDLLAKVNDLQPGDTIYLRAGTYSGKYDSENWNESNIVLFKTGTAAQPIAFLPYPGEVVTFQNAATRPNFNLGGGGRPKSNYVTIAGFNLVAPHSCISSGANSADSTTPESGSEYVRIVNNRCEITDATANTMTGMMSIGGDGGKLIGNQFVNPPNRAIINNNHAIYVQNGADDVEVAYNTLTNLRMGHVIQIHQDGTPMLYERINVHHNVLQGADMNDMRGITVSNVDDNSTVTIANNTLRNLGQNFSGVSVYHGRVTLENNEMYDINASAVLITNQGGGTRTISATGNRFGVNSGQSYFQIDFGAPSSELTASGNSYCGAGAPPALDTAGTAC